MKVETFDTEKGVYVFEVEHFDTAFHSHPAVEIIVAEKGRFSLYINHEQHVDLQFALIAANNRHRLSATDCKVKISMVEHHDLCLNNHLKSRQIDFSNGYIVKTSHAEDDYQPEEWVQLIKTGKPSQEYDQRVHEVLNYLNSNHLEYRSMIAVLCSITGLSESRLSHLFKSDVGVSLKKYLVWTKLKSTIKQHLEHNDDLFSAFIDSGFYDQPHFSRSFKNMLGVNPSKAYRSRNVQF